MNKNGFKIFNLILVAIFLPLITLARMNSETYLIEADILNSGGGQSSSVNYVLSDAFGEVAVSFSTSTNYQEQPLIASYLFRFLDMSVPTSTSFVNKTIDILSQTTTSTISQVEVTDDGTVGWSLTMATSHFTYLAPYQLLNGSNNTVNFSGTYDGTYGIISPVGTYIVEITTGGAVGAAIFKWTAPDGTVTYNITTSSNVLLSRGVSVNFSSTTYIVGDKWSASVDVFLYTGLLVTPGDVSVISGENGVSAGSPETLSGTGATSDAKSLMIGQANNSAGTYRQDQDLELTIHANSLLGNFTATATLTII